MSRFYRASAALSNALRRSKRPLHTMNWRENGVLKEMNAPFRSGNNDLFSKPQLLFAKPNNGPELVQLTYTMDGLVKGTQGITEYGVEDEMETQGGYEIEITVGKGDHPLGLQITSATEGKLTIMNPVKDEFTYTTATHFMWCEYKNDKWYWIFENDEVILRKYLVGKEPTKFFFNPAK